MVLKDINTPFNSITKKNLKHKRRFCLELGCDRTVKSQGRCQRHGAKAKLCRIAGCYKQAQGGCDSMCKSHFNYQPDRDHFCTPSPSQMLSQSSTQSLSQSSYCGQSNAVESFQTNEMNELHTTIDLRSWNETTCNFIRFDASDVEDEMESIPPIMEIYPFMNSPSLLCPTDSDLLFDLDNFEW